MEQKLVKIFEKMKSQNLFWSYSPEITANRINPDIFAETVLKFGAAIFFDVDSESIYNAPQKRNRL